MKDGVAKLVSRGWSVLLTMFLVALLAAPAQAHRGHHPGVAPSATAAMNSDTAEQAQRDIARGMHASVGLLASGLPCCPAGGSGSACCVAAGCVAPPASVPVEAVAVPRMHVDAIRLGASRAHGMHGIRAIPATPPPRSLTIAG